MRTGRFGTRRRSDTFGTDTFTSQVSDGFGVSNVATVSVGVEAVPVANDDSYATDENVVLNASPGVLDNDTEPSGLALTAVLVSGPSHGTLALNADGTFIYTRPSRHRRILMMPIAATESASNSSRSGDRAGIAAAATTIRFDVLLLFAVFESGADALTDAVFESGPAADGVRKVKSTIA